MSLAVAENVLGLVVANWGLSSPLLSTVVCLITTAGFVNLLYFGTWLAAVDNDFYEEAVSHPDEIL